MKTAFRLIAACFISACTTAAWAQCPMSTAQPAGTLDTCFNTGAGFDLAVNALAIQNDGKIIAGGAFNLYQNRRVSGLIRLNPDGSRDFSFKFDTMSASKDVRVVRILPGGKILIGGSFTSIQGLTRKLIARLNQDGTLDTTFRAVGIEGGGAGQGVNDLLVQPSGNIVALGNFYNLGDTVRNIAALLPNGARNLSFQARSLDGGAFSATQTPDGGLVVVGEFKHYGSTAYEKIVKLLPNGLVDTSFHSGRGVGNFIFPVYKVINHTTDRLLIGGNFSFYNLIPRNFIAQLTATGQVTDFGFNTRQGLLDWRVRDMVVQPDNKVIAVGGFETSGLPPYYRRLVRYLASGTYDTSFHAGAGLNGEATCVVWQPDGKILVGGSFGMYNGRNALRIARIFAPSAPTEVRQNLKSNALAAYPNPATKGTIAVSIQNLDRLLAVSIDGRQFALPPTAEPDRYSISGLMPGLYTLAATKGSVVAYGRLVVSQ